MENGMDYRFSKEVQLSRHRGPHRTKKNSLMRSACAWCVCVQGTLYYSKSTVMFSCPLGTSYCASAPRARRAGGAIPGPTHAPGRFAKAGQARLRSISADSWSTGVWAVTEPDACARSELQKFLRNQFSFFVENVRFVIFHPKLALPLPPFRNALCLEKNCSPDWFVLFDLKIFSGGVYPRAQPHAQSLFSISNSFWY